MITLHEAIDDKTYCDKFEKQPELYRFFYLKGQPYDDFDHDKKSCVICEEYVSQFDHFLDLPVSKFDYKGIGGIVQWKHLEEGRSLVCFKVPKEDVEEFKEACIASNIEV